MSGTQHRRGGTSYRWDDDDVCEKGIPAVTNPGESAKPIITLFEAYGAGASQVGPRLAEALGVRWIGQGVSSEELEAADPKGTGHININQFFRSVAFSDIGSIDLIESPSVVLARQNVETVRALVQDGGVILGRNATVILADRPEALHVKLEAPVEDRIRRAAAEAGISVEQASVRQRREDEARAEMSLELWGWDPRTTARYDLVVNTTTFGIDGAVEIILAAFARKQALTA